MEDKIEDLEAIIRGRDEEILGLEKYRGLCVEFRDALVGVMRLIDYSMETDKFKRHDLKVAILRADEVLKKRI